MRIDGPRLAEIISELAEHYGLQDPDGDEALDQVLEFAVEARRSWDSLKEEERNTVRSITMGLLEGIHKKQIRLVCLSDYETSRKLENLMLMVMAYASRAD